MRCFQPLSHLSAGAEANATTGVRLRGGVLGELDGRDKANEPDASPPPRGPHRVAVAAPPPCARRRARPTFSPSYRQAFAPPAESTSRRRRPHWPAGRDGPLDRDDLGSDRPKIMNVIDSNKLEHDVGGQPHRAFRQHAPARRRRRGIDRDMRRAYIGARRTALPQGCKRLRHNELAAFALTRGRACL